MTWISDIDCQLIAACLSCLMFPAFDKKFFIDMVILHGEPPWLSVCEIPNE